MYTRHNEVPLFSRRQGQLDALYFNHVLVALRRRGPSIRFAIPRLKHLDLILQKDAWIIVDRVLNDVPVAAWTDFETEGRASLHEPIKCEIRTYHAMASGILKRTLEAMELLLGEELADDLPDEKSDVVAFQPGSPKSE